MPDPLPSGPEKKKEGNSKTWSAILAGMFASYFMNKLSLAGVDFATFDVSSEVVKSFLIGNLVGLFAWLTPRNVVQAIRDAIIFCREAWKDWRSAAEN